MAVLVRTVIKFIRPNWGALGRLKMRLFSKSHAPDVFLTSFWYEKHCDFFSEFFDHFLGSHTPLKPFHYNLYKFLYSLTVKNSKMTETRSFLIFFYFCSLMFRKLPKIDVFLLRLVIFDEICSFQRGVKILFLRIFEDFDPPLEWTYFVKSDQTQQKYINFGEFSEHFCSRQIYEKFTMLSTF